ncbi:MAG: VWA domain-containing protein [Myxococcales bacterium]|nr:VWA domain-containing protein [Myxococcales bacterium]
MSVAALLGGCTDAFIEPLASQPTQLDDRLTLTGRVCTAPPSATGFPVKVVFIIDESGSMCVSDPPGSQQGSGFCEQAAVRAIVPAGITEPARVRALRKLLQQFAPQPNVEVAIVPFETNVKNVWPPTTTGRRFARPDSSLATYISGLQSQLGKGTDYQGALSYAYSLIATDIGDVANRDPVLLPRTRYVVVFLSDGTPYPRCAANDNLSQYADPDNPWLTWADSSGTGDYCNTIDPQDPDAITGFIKGTDRNQNYQLFSYVDQLMELKQQYNVGDVRMHTVLLFNEAAVAACGTICTDLYGSYPNVSPGNYPAAAKKIARWTLQQFALRGNGVYQEFNNSEIYAMGLGALDYSSLASRNVMKALIVHTMSSVPGQEQRLVDSDGDGLPDELDNSFTYKTNNFFPDSDGDCFDDNFEVLRADKGFKPYEKDGRGCDPNSPLTLGCSCRDTDGDGLSQFAEDFLKTRPGLADSDGDGVTDGLEARYGLDPLAANAAGVDTDGDGLPDETEVRIGSHPTRRDRDFSEREGYQFESLAEEQTDGSVCYDFRVANLKLVTPPSRAGVRQGYNLFKVFFAESPESGVATDYGVWRAGCAWAQYDPPSIREPVGPELAMTNQNFARPELVASDTAYQTRCVGKAP